MIDLDRALAISQRAEALMSEASGGETRAMAGTLLGVNDETAARMLGTFEDYAWAERLVTDPVAMFICGVAYGVAAERTR